MEKESLIKQLMDEMDQIIIGKHDIVELLVTVLLANGHVLLEDVPGVGKTTMANALAGCLALGFTRIQFTPDTLPSDVTGMSVYNMKTGEFEYVKGAIMNQIILGDEINRTSPKTQAALLEAMEEGQVTVDGTIYPLPKPFMVIATENPTTYLGTYYLPEAEMDRFMMRLSIGYPSNDDEVKMVEQFLYCDSWKKAEPVMTPKQLMGLQLEVTKVKVHKDIIKFAIDTVEKTRNDPQIELGISPRGTLSWIRAAQSYAYISGRDYVTPDDMRKVSSHVLAHRIILSSEAKLTKVSEKKILAAILNKTALPII